MSLCLGSDEAFYDVSLNVRGCESLQQSLASFIQVIDRVFASSLACVLAARSLEGVAVFRMRVQPLALACCLDPADLTNSCCHSLTRSRSRSLVRTQPELLDGDNRYTPTKALGPQRCEKGVAFLSFPPVLQLHLKRFTYDLVSALVAVRVVCGVILCVTAAIHALALPCFLCFIFVLLAVAQKTGNRIKVNDAFSFPPVLDLAPFLDAKGLPVREAGCPTLTCCAALARCSGGGQGQGRGWRRLGRCSDGHQQ